MIAAEQDKMFFASPDQVITTGQTAVVAQQPGFFRHRVAVEADCAAANQFAGDTP